MYSHVYTIFFGLQTVDGSGLDVSMASTADGLVAVDVSLAVTVGGMLLSFAGAAELKQISG